LRHPQVREMFATDESGDYHPLFVETH